MVDWNLAITVAVGVMAGVFTVVALVVALIWAIDRIDKWRTARKTEQEQTQRQTVTELTRQNRELQRQLRVVEAERARLEQMSRDLMLQQPVEDKHRLDKVVVRTRYERMLASE